MLSYNQYNNNSAITSPDHPPPDTALSPTSKRRDVPIVKGGVPPERERMITSDNGYESGSVSRESGVSEGAAGHYKKLPTIRPIRGSWLPTMRSIGVSASFDDLSEVPDPEPGILEEALSPQTTRSQFTEPQYTEPHDDLLSPMTTLCYDPPFDRPFNSGYFPLSNTDLPYNSTPHQNIPAPPPASTSPQDYTTLMKLCGEGDATALDSFLAVNPDSLKRTGNSYLGVMANVKSQSMKITSTESVTVPEPQVIISPIVSAILGGNSECVRLLVEAGASVNSPAGITDNMCARADCPLSCALRVDRMDVAEYLVSQGASVGEALMRLAGCTDRRLANLLGVRLGCTVNVVVSRDPDMQALWRLITPQILVLTPAPLESAFLLGRAFKLLGCARPTLTSHWQRLGTSCERFSVQLIDQCLSPQEVTAIMSRDDRPSALQTAPIHDALYYGRNEFVSHPAAYRMLQRRITRTKDGSPNWVDVVMSLASPLVLPFLAFLSYLVWGPRSANSPLRKYMYRIYSPFALFASSLLLDLLLLILVTACCLSVAAQNSITVLEVVTWTVGLGVLAAEIQRRKLLVWYYQFRFVCNLLLLTWFTSIFLLKLRLHSHPAWSSGTSAVQILYGVLLVTLSLRLLSICRPLIPCNPLCVIAQILPDFLSFVAVAGVTYLLFNVAIHTVYSSTQPNSVTTFFTVLFLSLHSVISTPGDGSAGALAGQILFIGYILLSLLIFFSFAIACLGKVEVSHRSCAVERRCSVMRLVMMHEGCHPIPAPANILTLPLTIAIRPFTRSYKKGIKRVVWGEEADDGQFELHNREDTLARVCARLKTLQQKNTTVEHEDFYDAVMTMREDLYRLTNKLDSEGIKLDALQAVWSSFVNLQDNLSSLQSQVRGLVKDGEKNNTLLVEQSDRVLGLRKLLEENREVVQLHSDTMIPRDSPPPRPPPRASTGARKGSPLSGESSCSTGGRFSDI